MTTYEYLEDHIDGDQLAQIKADSDAVFTVAEDLAAGYMALIDDPRPATDIADEFADHLAVVA